VGQDDAVFGMDMQKHLVTPTGFEHPPQNTGETAISEIGGAKSGAFSPDFEQIDPDLQSILDAWPTLPEAVRAGILAMIGACKPDA
jgi:hypothetical protein